MDRARMENGELNRFFNWAYRTRGNTVKALAEGEKMAPEKIFLSFTSIIGWFIKVPSSSYVIRKRHYVINISLRVYPELYVKIYINSIPHLVSKK